MVQGWKAVAAAGCLAAALLAPSGAEAAERRVLVIASGEPSGSYYPVAGAFCRVVNRDRPHNDLCTVLPTQGSAANLAALRAGDADLAIVQARAARAALTGEEGFAGQPFADLRAVMSLHGEAALALVRPGGGIDHLTDLRGRKVNLGRPGSFQRMMADAMLSAVGLSEGDLGSAFELDPADQAHALCDGDIDVAFFSGIHPMPEAESAIEACDAVALALPARNAESVAERTPWLAKTTLRGGTYDGIKEDQTTLAVKALLVTTTRLPTDEIRDLVKALHGNFAAFTTLTPALKGLTKADSVHDGMAIPLHEGAQKLYLEGGLSH